jgi:NhaP-type Na+/H+ or K+/H+ antiporter
VHDYPVVIFLAALVVGFGLISRLTERLPFTAPMVFVALGLLAGPLGLGWISGSLDDTVIRLVAEITLVSVLFVEASTLDVRALAAERGIAMRLLLIGLPLTMGLGTLAAGLLLPGAGWWLLALLAFILSPTDAALGQAVVTSPGVPGHVRRAIAAESGINDGLVLPPILICIAALGAGASDSRDLAYWIDFTTSQLIMGPLIGAGVGWIGGLLVDRAAAKRFMNATFQRLAAGSLAVLAWALAEQFGGNGYIAAFAGGLFLGIRTHAVRERVQEYAEAEGQLLTLFVFLIFGMLMVPAAVPHWTWQAWVYALLSLTLIRMVPVGLSLLGSTLRRGERAFIGWFGPRGIASVLYLEMVILDLGLAGLETVLAVAVLTILLSVILHGISAVPLSAVLAGATANNAARDGRGG